MKLLFATANQNKYEEVLSMLPPDIELLSLNDVDFHEDIPETQETIEGNAKQKVEYISNRLNIESFADDTGLEVNALNGQPGVYSARYAGDEKDAQKNMTKLLVELDGKSSRSAQFKTIIALRLNNRIELFTGILRGKIINEQRGNFGFGYDPIFVPEGHHKSLAELTKEEKNAISHRSIAFQKLVTFLESKK